MYRNTRSKVIVNNSFSEEFKVKVGVQQGFRPLLFIIVLQALSSDFRTGSPWELLYADNLVIIADTEEELRRKLLLWKQGMKLRG